MGIAEQYNKASRFTTDVDTKDFKFFDLADLYHTIPNGETTVIRGMYINHKSKFGDAPVLVTDKMFVNLPKHLTDTVNEMMHDSAFVDAVNQGKVGFTIYTYKDKKYNRDCFSVTWVDID